MSPRGPQGPNHSSKSLLWAKFQQFSFSDKCFVFEQKGWPLVSQALPEDCLATHCKIPYPCAWGPGGTLRSYVSPSEGPRGPSQCQRSILNTLIMVSKDFVTVTMTIPTLCAWGAWGAFSILCVAFWGPPMVILREYFHITLWSFSACFVTGILKKKIPLFVFGGLRGPSASHRGPSECTSV